jgi:hypothetical protein
MQMEDDDENNSEEDENNFSNIFSWLEQEEQPPMLHNTITKYLQQYNNNNLITKFLPIYFNTIMKEKDETEHSWQYTLFTQNDFIVQFLQTLEIIVALASSHQKKIGGDTMLCIKFLLFCLRNYTTDNVIMFRLLQCILRLDSKFGIGEQVSNEMNVLLIDVFNGVLDVIDYCISDRCGTDINQCYRVLGNLRRTWQDSIEKCLEPYANRWCRDDASVKERCVALDIFSICHFVPEPQHSWFYQQIFAEDDTIVDRAVRAIRKNYILLFEDLFNNGENKQVEAMRTLNRISELLISDNDSISVKVLDLLYKAIVYWDSGFDMLYDTFQKDFLALLASDKLLNNRLIGEVFKLLLFFISRSVTNDFNFDDVILKCLDGMKEMDAMEFQEVFNCFSMLVDKSLFERCQKSAVRLFQISLEQMKKGSSSIESVDYFEKVMDDQFVREFILESGQCKIEDIRQFVRDLMAYQENYFSCLSIICKLCSNGILEYIKEQDESLQSLVTRILMFVNCYETEYIRSFTYQVRCVVSILRYYGHKLSKEEMESIKNSDIWKNVIQLIMELLNEVNPLRDENERLYSTLILVIELHWYNLADNTLELFNQLIASQFYNSFEFIYNKCKQVTELYRLCIGLLRLILATDVSKYSKEVKEGLRDAIEPCLEGLDFDIEEVQVYIPLHERVMIKLL